jgi:hypothetical protein
MTSNLSGLEARLRAVEDQLAASQATVAAQRELLHVRGAGAAEPSKLSNFLSDLEIGGFVTASYVYNENNPDENTFSQTLCQFNCNHNEFSFDAAKLELGKAASAPGTAGFQFDLLFGQNASILQGLSPDGSGTGQIAGPAADGSSDTELFVQQAYVSYNYNDLVFKFGKWETLLGWEVIDSHKNYNVSHGILFTWAIPLFHTGILASGNFGENFGFALGVANGFNNSVDMGDNKAVLGQVSWKEGPIFSSLSTYIGTLNLPRTKTNGTLVEDDDSTAQIFDWVLQYTPDDDFDTWLNIDYGKASLSSNNQVNGGSAGSARWYGASAGAAYQIDERWSLAVRGEWFRDDQGFRFGCPGGTFNCAALPAGFTPEVNAYSLTGTLGYKLTQNLMARFEVRHDIVDVDPDRNEFPDDGDPGRTSAAFAPDADDATYGIFEVSYVFD